MTEILRGLRPDVACLCEAPGVLTLRRLARRSNLTVVARSGRRGWGSAVLLGGDARALSHDRVTLSAPAGVPTRSAAQAIVGVGGTRLGVVSTQLGLRPEVRQANAGELEAVLARLDVPVVLAGDFNESPGGAAVRQLTEVLRDAFAVAGEGRGETYPNPDPTSRQDLVLVGREVTVLRCWVPGVAPVPVASHHRPVVVELATADEQPTSEPDVEPAA